MCALGRIVLSSSSSSSSSGSPEFPRSGREYLVIAIERRDPRKRYIVINTKRICASLPSSSWSLFLGVAPAYLAAHSRRDSTRRKAVIQPGRSRSEREILPNTYDRIANVIYIRIEWQIWVKKKQEKNLNTNTIICPAICSSSRGNLYSSWAQIIKQKRASEESNHDERF